jgi:hypothetical protein
LGGSIEINSPPGHGTRVAVQLPLELDLSPDESNLGGLTDAGKPLVPD